MILPGLSINFVAVGIINILSLTVILANSAFGGTYAFIFIKLNPSIRNTSFCWKFNGTKTETIYLISNPTAIDRLITKIKFNGSKSLKESKVIIKKIGKVIVKAYFFAKKNLNIKKKKELTSMFIIKIMERFIGGIM